MVKENRKKLLSFCSLLLSVAVVSAQEPFERQIIQLRQGIQAELQLQQLDYAFRLLIEEIVVKAEPSKPVRPLGVLVSRQDPSQIYNAQWNSDIVRPLGGIPTLISAAFSREPDAFLTVYPQVPGTSEQEPPLLYHLRSLLNWNPKVEVNRTVYTLSLSPRWPDKLASKVVFSRSGERHEVVARDALKAVYAKGRPVNIGGTEYRFFYARDVEHDKKEKKAFFAKTETFFFIAEVGREDYKVFYVPVESVPTDGEIAYFKLHQDRPAGLRLIPKTAAISAQNSGPSLLAYLLEIYVP